MYARVSEERRVTPMPVAEVLNAATAADAGDRRRTERHPFFYPVNVCSPKPGAPNYSAFSRDISAGGMGLLHNMPLDPGPVVLTILGDSASDVRLTGDISWCVPCGEGWFTSGVRFNSDAG